jgi:ABC-type transport system involved in cytochrome c biogenesis ATPase subunit
VDESVCASEFLQLLPAAIVRLVTAEQATSGPSDESAGIPESIAAVLHPVITVAMSYLESDVRVSLAIACLWLMSKSWFIESFMVECSSGLMYRNRDYSAQLREQEFGCGGCVVAVTHHRFA